MSTTSNITNQFDLQKNGKVAVSVFANAETKEIVSANKNSFGFNHIQQIGSDFYSKYGKNLKTNQGKRDYTQFTYSEKAMNSVGFVLVKRGENPIF